MHRSTCGHVLLSLGRMDPAVCASGCSVSSAILHVCHSFAYFRAPTLGNLIILVITFVSYRIDSAQGRAPDVFTNT